MIVVSDTSPISNLLLINKINLLHQIYGSLIVPPTVHQEICTLSDLGYDIKTYTNANWIEIKAPTKANRFLELREILDAGESEAIALAEEIEAGKLLIDERAGRLVAEQLGLKTIGLLGTLLTAKERRLIDNVSSILHDLKTISGFWVSTSLEQLVLRKAGELL